MEGEDIGFILLKFLFFDLLFELIIVDFLIRCFCMFKIKFFGFFLDCFFSILGLLLFCVLFLFLMFIWLSIVCRLFIDEFLDLFFGVDFLY